ncbi:MAG: hypothetical protein LDL07_03215 [Desulfarculus sp.]|nr:hypothetical protein [Desulfarculus sp.]
MIAWIKANKGKAAAIGATIAAAAGGVITWSDAARQVLAALGLGVQ